MVTLPQLDIDVTGQSSLMLAPERAVLSVEVLSRTKNDKATCTTQAIKAARDVETVLRQASKNASVDYWSRDSLSESQHTPGWSEKNPNPATEYTSRVNFDTHVQQFAPLGSLIHLLTSVSHVQSRGVDWVLTPATQNAQRSHLRAEVASNARQEAEEYAAALGYKNVWAFEVRESAAYVRSSNRKGGPGAQRREDVGTVTRNMAEEGWEDGSEEAFQYSPEDVSMTQNVQVKFLTR